jgi:hypothetical protein
MLPLDDCFRASGQVGLFPSAESTNEGVSVLVSQEVGSFIQFEDGVVEIVASKLMTGFF